MSDNLSKKMMISEKYSKEFDSFKWMDSLPFLKFPTHWLIKIVPPALGATVRFKVKHAESMNRDNSHWDVSIYFDGYDLLGGVGGPYWEIYPNIDGSNSRFLLGQEIEMLAAIEESLQYINKKEKK